ncbi:MAG: hypothetical protein F2832_07135 [Actinobacteria bacterium]|nr:hypothetical protein [Actinomycetota bacterium]
MALHAFATEAAWQLAADAHDGDELAFEVVEEGRRDTPLYCYRPLTGAFIRDHAAVLSRLPAYLPATQALITAGRLDAWLEAQGIHAGPGRERVDASLHCFLSRMFGDATDFVFSQERFDAAFAELESVLGDNMPQTVVVAVLHGIEIESEVLDLGDGLSIERGETCSDAPDEARWARGDGGSQTLAVLRWDPAADDTAPLAYAHVQLRRMVLGLRLYDAATVALAPLAWIRAGNAPWQPLALGTPGAGHGLLVVTPGHEDELRAFLNLVARRTPRHGEIAWALRRFELAGERPVAAEALTDLLLALRALLEPEGPASGELPGRLAALCAEAQQRTQLTERIAHIVSLERAIISGRPVDPHFELLVRELAGHLRALLRDVLCGHLDADLPRIADAIVGRRLPEPFEEQSVEHAPPTIRAARRDAVEEDVFF